MVYNNVAKRDDGLPIVRCIRKDYVAKVSASLKIILETNIYAWCCKSKVGPFRVSGRRAPRLNSPLADSVDKWLRDPLTAPGPF